MGILNRLDMRDKGLIGTSCGSLPRGLHSAPASLLIVSRIFVEKIDILVAFGRGHSYYPVDYVTVSEMM